MSLLNELINEFGLGASDLQRIIATAPLRYKTYPIDKRRGGKRIIAQPSPELKAIQRYIVRTKLSSLPIHRAATGYVEGKNILHNAIAHRFNRVILKLDFKEFFPSLKVEDWVKYISNKKIKKIDVNDLILYSQLLFWGNKTNRPVCLSIGAPSSPILSNILMYDLDTKFAKAAKQYEVVYTRYADDITASARNLEALIDFEKAVISAVRKAASPKLHFNEEKRGIYMRGQRRMVTGLIITPSAQISIGRERKRLISSMMHRASLNQSDAEGMAHLKGLLGFCLANEPEFVGRLRAKYGDEVVNRVLKFDVPPRELS